MSILLLLVVFLLLFVYYSSLETIRDEFSKLNEQKIQLVESNMVAAVDQSRKIGIYLCTETDSQVFLEFDDPIAADGDIYTRISARLKSYEFGIDYISSMLLYSQKHQRLIDETGVYELNAGSGLSAKEADTGWMSCISPENEGKLYQLFTRAENGRYPFVLTVVQKYQIAGVDGITVINLDLKKLYNAIWPEDREDTEVFVLDEDGSIIICRGKQKLYESIESEKSLENFHYTEETVNRFFMDGKTAKTYSQQYNEDLKMYFVSVSTLDDYNERIGIVQRKILMVFFGVMMVIGSVIFFYCRTSFTPLQSIMEILNDPKYWIVKNSKASVDVKEVSEQIIFHLQNNKDLREELKNHLELLKETQIQALQTQLNPHFLFNTLDAIEMMVEDREDEDIQVSKLVRSLTDILRYSLSGNDLETIDREFFYLKKYIYILQCRYGDSFEVSYQVSDKLKNILVPKLILQPLVENAVFHGLMARESENGGYLEIKGEQIRYSFEQEEENAVLLEVIDNGYGIPAARLEQLRDTIKDMKHIETEHIGVQNVAKRLYLLFAERCVVEVNSEQGVGTNIRLIFPKIERIKEEPNELF